jgi:transglutaminase-like putative cysteine protease
LKPPDFHACYEGYIGEHWVVFDPTRLAPANGLLKIGWCGCDPTINEISSHKHILTGVSSHPRGVMPVSGSYYGGAELYLGMEVAVKMEKNPAGAAISGVLLSGVQESSEGTGG